MDLMQIINKLRGYCHQPDCGWWDACPGSHKRCRDKLDLDTRIAWRVAEIVNSCRVGGMDPRAAYEKVRELDAIVFYHRDKYPKLADLTYTAVVYLRDRFSLAAGGKGGGMVYSIREIKSRMEDLLDEGYRTLTLAELLEVLGWEREDLMEFIKLYEDAFRCESAV